MSKFITLKPRLSEKSFALSEQRNTYLFEVPSGINRHEVANAVAGQYSVTVEAVRIATQPSKNKRTFKRGGRVVYRGTTTSIRKAYVKLKEGDKLPIFAATEDNKKPEKEGK